jgi:hypothetical protein
MPKHIELKDLLAIDGGLLYIIHRYPDARESENKTKRKFKVRPEKTASAGLKQLEDGTWIVTDFGNDSKGRNAVAICQHEDGVDFVTALRTVAAFYNFEGESLPEAKAGYNCWAAKPDEAEGSMTFDYKEFEQHDVRTIFSPYAWAAMGKDDEARLARAVTLCAYYHLKCLKLYTYTTKGKTHEYSSTELFPSSCGMKATGRSCISPRPKRNSASSRTALNRKASFMD